MKLDTSLSRVSLNNQKFDKTLEMIYSARDALDRERQRLDDAKSQHSKKSKKSKRKSNASPVKSMMAQSESEFNRSSFYDGNQTINIGTNENMNMSNYATLSPKDIALRQYQTEEVKFDKLYKETEDKSKELLIFERPERTLLHELGLSNYDKVIGEKV